MKDIARKSNLLGVPDIPNTFLDKPRRSIREVLKSCITKLIPAQEA